MGRSDINPEADEVLRLSLFGAAGTNSNLGVQALMVAAVTGVRQLVPTADITVFDDGFGVETVNFQGRAGDVAYRRCGARLSRQFYRQESYWNMRAAMRTVASANRGTSLLMRSHAVMDITGGDSFTDLYGRRRFAAALAPKWLALDAGRRLILLPQAYGPFANSETFSDAAIVLRRASAAWARDEGSFATMIELLGDAFDPEHHRLGVDVAFGLDAIKPCCSLADSVLGLKERHSGRPLVGMNISGMLYNDPHSARRFGMGLEYRTLCVSLLKRILSESESCVMLINHVLDPSGMAEADRVAAADVMRTVAPYDRNRILVVPDPPGPGEAKWCISQCDWFVGARMHATIAALSSGVPAAVVAYSHKAVGVFATCGMEADVADVRTDLDTAIRTIWRSFERRTERRVLLRSRLPEVSAKASSQMTDIVNLCRAASAGR